VHRRDPCGLITFGERNLVAIRSALRVVPHADCGTLNRYLLLQSNWPIAFG
jgi:hypothetical protein